MEASSSWAPPREAGRSWSKLRRPLGPSPANSPRGASRAEIAPLGPPPGSSQSVASRAESKYSSGDLALERAFWSEAVMEQVQRLLREQTNQLENSFAEAVRGLPAPAPGASSSGWGGPALAAQEKVCRLQEELLLAQREVFEEMRLGRPDGAQLRGAPASQAGAAEECEEPLLLDDSAERKGIAVGTGAMFPPRPDEGDPPALAKHSAGPNGRRHSWKDLTRLAGAEEWLASQLGRFTRLDEMLDFWRRTHGMHTVDDWAMNYKEHPGGYGALLMIHGVQELTGRLKHKVENYAIYSALFLSMSIALIASPADFIFEPCEDDDALCPVGKRIFVYGLSLGTALHMLCIMLAMAVVNALNEAARDCDVYRILSRGEGYKATQKCAVCFFIGCASDLIAVLVTTCEYLDIVEPLVLNVVLVSLIAMIYIPTSQLLFGSSSILSYWRKDRGGNPDPDDPFDLELPAHCVHERATMNKLMRASMSNNSGQP